MRPRTDRQKDRQNDRQTDRPTDRQTDRQTESRQRADGLLTQLASCNADGVKIDGCGHQRNQTLYAQLMAESGKNYTIEK
jgi:hypothetical protein